MTEKPRFNWRFWGLRAAAMVAAGLLFASQSAAPVTAGSQDRTLWLYHTHTHETGKFTYWHNGQYDQGVLRQMNVFLADWRNHKSTRMDPKLFDLLWEVYQDVGGAQPYNIVSAYRSPETNAYLRSRSSAVAEHSQHMLGHAMDVFIPGVSLSKLRSTAMLHQVGGVGFYPTSGSPFVHMDVGTVRAWPRMTRAQLKSVFPDGKTLHLPVDGTPLSNSGRQYAQAEWNKCHQVPCTGVIQSIPQGDDNSIQVASLDPSTRAVSTIDIMAPVPMLRPHATTEPTMIALDPNNNPFGSPATTDQLRIEPFSKAAAMMVATRDILAGDAQTALGAIDSTMVPVPAPRVLMTPRDNQVLTAYAPDIAPEPGAQRALALIIDRQTTASAKPPAVVASLAPTPIRLPRGGTTGLDLTKNFFDMTWSAVSEAGSNNAIADTLTNSTIDPEPMVGLKQRDFDLIQPEIDHVNETLTTPVPITDMHYAEMYEPEGYLDNAAELGQYANRMGLTPDDVAPPRYDIFVVHAPFLTAARG